MSVVNVQIPNSIHQQLKELARKDGISIDQLITSAVVEKASALMTLDYLENRARRGSWDKFESALAKVPSAVPDERDRL